MRFRIRRGRVANLGSEAGHPRSGLCHAFPILSPYQRLGRHGSPAFRGIELARSSLVCACLPDQQGRRYPRAIDPGNQSWRPISAASRRTPNARKSCSPRTGLRKGIRGPGAGEQYGIQLACFRLGLLKTAATDESAMGVHAIEHHSVTQECGFGDACAGASPSRPGQAVHSVPRRRCAHSVMGRESKLACGDFPTMAGSSGRCVCGCCRS
jgi:hypothetical protein